jgi:hypothetical protein
VERSGESLDLEIIAELFGEPLEGSEPTHLFQIAYVDVSDGLAALADLEAEGGTDTDAVGDWGTTGDLPELPGDAGDDVVPEYLRGVDLREPGAVALAELDHLLIAKEARLDLPPASFVTASGRRGIVYQVVVPPGAFVRAYYVPAHRAVVRAAFVSVFDLDSTDVAMMAETMHTGEESP